MPEPGVPKGAEGAEPHPGLVTWQCHFCGKKVEVRVQLKTPKSYPYMFWSHSPSGWIHSHGDNVVACSSECAEKFR